MLCFHTSNRRDSCRESLLNLTAHRRRLFEVVSAYTEVHRCTPIPLFTQSEIHIKQSDLSQLFLFIEHWKAFKMTEKPREVKVVLLGDTGVGKSSLVLRFVTNSFKPYSESTIGASFMSKLVMVNGKQIKFQIWDTAGQEKYKSLARKLYVHISRQK